MPTAIVDLRVVTVRKIDVGGRTFWFGEIGDPHAIRVIYPDPALTPHTS